MAELFLSASGPLLHDRLGTVHGRRPPEPPVYLCDEHGFFALTSAERLVDRLESIAVGAETRDPDWLLRHHSLGIVFRQRRGLAVALNLDRIAAVVGELRSDLMVPRNVSIELDLIAAISAIYLHELDHVAHRHPSAEPDPDIELVWLAEAEAQADAFMALCHLDQTEQVLAHRAQLFMSRLASRQLPPYGVFLQQPYSRQPDDLAQTKQRSWVLGTSVEALRRLVSRQTQELRCASGAVIGDQIIPFARPIPSPEELRRSVRQVLAGKQDSLEAEEGELTSAPALVISTSPSEDEAHLMVGLWTSPGVTGIRLEGRKFRTATQVWREEWDDESGGPENRITDHELRQVNLTELLRHLPQMARSQGPL